MRGLTLTFAIVVACLVAARASVASSTVGSVKHRRPEAPTRLFLGNRKVSQLEPSHGVYDLTGDEWAFISRYGNLILAVDTTGATLFESGYTRTTSAHTWYVNQRNETSDNPAWVTIGAVMFRGPGVWDAYCGLDGHARWYGYAAGPHAGMGAVALLLVFGCARLGPSGNFSE